jgi:VanZ family protein
MVIFSRCRFFMKFFKKMTVKYFWPAGFWTVVVTFLSCTASLPKMDFNLFSIDKLAHFAVYFLLTWLILWGFYKKNSSISTGEKVFAFAFSAGWGLLMEWVQATFFPHRMFEWDDEIANASGAFLGLLCFFTKISENLFLKNKKA